MSATTDLWTARARGDARDEIDRLRQVMDPTDLSGVKNTYLDRYLKHYLVEHLDPRPENVVLEVGCGTGRLVEHVAPSVRMAYGTDLVDDFVLACRERRGKADNTRYLTQNELGALAQAGIDKLFIVWVLMYLRTDADAVALLRDYRERLPALRSAVLIEQVKTRSEEEQGGARADFYCRYRTIEEYLHIFTRAGFVVRSHTVMAERRRGPLYLGLRALYRVLPRAAAGLGEPMFAVDHGLTAAILRGHPLATSQRVPTDVVFELDVP